MWVLIKLSVTYIHIARFNFDVKYICAFSHLLLFFHIIFVSVFFLIYPKSYFEERDLVDLISTSECHSTIRDEEYGR